MQNTIATTRNLIRMAGVVFISAFIFNFYALSHTGARVMAVPLFSFDFQSMSYSGSMLPFLIPVIIDIFLALAVRVVMRNESVGETPYLAWSIIAVTTMVSIVLNGLHYNVLPKEVFNINVESVVIMLTIPSAILLSTELIRGLLHSEFLRNNTIKATSELIEKLAKMKDEFSKNQEEHLSKMESVKKEQTEAQNLKEKLLKEIEQIRSSMADLKHQKRQQTKVNNIPTDKLALAHKADGMLLVNKLDKGAKVSLGEVARTLDISRTTLNTYLGYLNGNRMSGDE